MNRISILLSFLSCLVAGTSLWVSSGAVDATQLHRIEAERGLLARALQSVESRLDAVQADLRTSVVEPPRRVSGRPEPVPQAAPGAEGREASPLLDTLGDAQVDLSDVLARFRGLEEEEREDALKELGDLAREGDPRALELVLDGLNDPSADVRQRAAKILGSLEDPAYLEHLQTAAGDPDPGVRSTVAKSLDDLPVEAAGPVLVGMLRDGDAEVVDEVIKALAKLDYREARPQLLGQLGAEDLDVASRAASALRGMGDEDAAHDTIARILEDFRGAGIEARCDDVNRLRRIGGPTAIAELRTILETDASFSVREAARQALIKLGQ